MKRLLAIFSLLMLATAAVAHTAAPPMGHEVRLLHDCNDDYFGGDVIGNQAGHELHALDLHEAWDEELGNIVVFSLILAGEGPGEITTSLKAGSSSHSYTWSTSGQAWTGSFDRVDGPFQAKKADGTDDGDRFVLHGIVAQSQLGAKGTKLTDYTVQSKANGEDADAMPGYDGGITGSCSDDFKRPDYALAGPVQFAGLSLEGSTITLEAGSETFVQVTASNKLSDQAQRITITPTGTGPVSVQMHNPSTDAYNDELRLDLNKKGSAGDSKIAHVAVTGTSAGSGAIEVELTTTSGGRIVQTIQYTVTAEQGESDTETPAPVQPDETTEPAEAESPGFGWLAPAIGLAGILRIRRS